MRRRLDYSQRLRTTSTPVRSRFCGRPGCGCTDTADSPSGRRPTPGTAPTAVPATAFAPVAAAVRGAAAAVRGPPAEAMVRGPASPSPWNPPHSPAMNPIPPPTSPASDILDITGTDEELDAEEEWHGDEGEDVWGTDDELVGLPTSSAEPHIPTTGKYYPRGCGTYLVPAHYHVLGEENRGCTWCSPPTACASTTSAAPLDSYEQFRVQPPLAPPQLPSRS